MKIKNKLPIFKIVIDDKTNIDKIVFTDKPIHKAKIIKDDQKRN